MLVRRPALGIDTVPALEGHLMLDHVHMLILIPPKYAVSQVVGFIKGKSAFHLARVYGKGSATLWDSTSGPEGTSSTRSGEMSRRYGPTSATRRRRIRG